MNGTERATDAQPSNERRALFEELYYESHTAILGYVLRRTEDPEDASDAIAETFLIAWRRLDAIPEGDQRRPWLYGVARRVLANQRRGERRRFALTQRLTVELAQMPRPSEPTGALAETAAAFSRLTDADREILALAGWEELSAAQIATVLGCSRNAARIRLHRARRHLDHQLARERAQPSASEPHPRPGEAI